MASFGWHFPHRSCKGGRLNGRIVHNQGEGCSRPSVAGFSLLQTNLVDVHEYVYTDKVKRRELEEALRKLRWRFLRHGAKHDVWTDGERQEPIPRHTEINEKLARAILHRAGRRD